MEFTVSSLPASIVVRTNSKKRQLGRGWPSGPLSRQSDTRGAFPSHCSDSADCTVQFLELVRLAELSEQLIRRQMHRMGLAQSLTDYRLLYSLAECRRGEPWKIGVPGTEEELASRLGCQRTRIALRLGSLKRLKLLEEVAPRNSGELKRYRLTTKGLHAAIDFWMAQQVAFQGLVWQAGAVMPVDSLRALAGFMEQRLQDRLT